MHSWASAAGGRRLPVLVMVRRRGGRGSTTGVWPGLSVASHLVCDARDEVLVVRNKHHRPREALNAVGKGRDRSGHQKAGWESRQSVKGGGARHEWERARVLRGCRGLPPKRRGRWKVGQRWRMAIQAEREIMCHRTRYTRVFRGTRGGG